MHKKKRIKRPTSILLKEIILYLKEGKKTSLEIAKKVYRDNEFYDKKRIEELLKDLSDVGIVSIIKEGEDVFYVLSDNYNSNTFFGLPLSEEQERNAETLFYFIKKFFSNLEKSNDSFLFNTLAQKVAFEVLKKNSAIKVPYGWYLYGGTTVVSFDKSKNYVKKTQLEEGIIEDIKSAVEKYSNYDAAWKIKKMHYDLYAPPIYAFKEDILKNLNSFIKNPSEYFLENIEKNIIRIINNMPDKSFDIVKKHFEKYSSLTKNEFRLVIRNKNILDTDKILLLVSLYKDLFESIWKLYALLQFKKDLEEFYSEGLLDQKFKVYLYQQDEEIFSAFYELKENLSETVND